MEYLTAWRILWRI